ncbi:MAG: 2-amino-4-hydroxy-6-hydroxymethyldihydropteridine diphosphokinase [Salibacteraceae bacterium]
METFSAYLLTGSNLNQPERQLQLAYQHIEKRVGKVWKASNVYQSKAWGFEHPNDFLNQVVGVHTQLSPELLLDTLLKIESEMGRQRKTTDGYEARVIDLDILLIDDLILDTPRLQVPHPRMHQRQFTLLPLLEIAPQLTLPGMNQSVAELSSALSDSSVIRYSAPYVS